ncbi:sushi, von Willebrand factor type A, EGF and pentraxin domain-containing protein 1-like [Sycon ciliatum]|uniref:sushi, von Willebrand factor type A, EGF and pentraxin domain-containing protein 1-like n=1 Tax=Sycon ciliatum TaxID=27933 RepID=UPI0031F65703
MGNNSEKANVNSNYLVLTPGYHIYGFQYVRVSSGQRSPIGAKFSVGTPPEGKCGVIPTISHGEYQVVDAGVGNVATYHCSPGYHMMGSGLAICQENGQWSEAPSCGAFCQPSHTPNGRIEQLLPPPSGPPVSAFPLAEVEPECDEGYKSMGKATCSGDGGEWEYETPLCDTPTNARVIWRKLREARRQAAMNRAGSGNGGSDEGDRKELFEEGPASESSQSVESLAGKTYQSSRNVTGESTVMQV